MADIPELSGPNEEADKDPAAVHVPVQPIKNDDTPIGGVLVGAIDGVVLDADQFNQQVDTGVAAALRVRSPRMKSPAVLAAAAQLRQDVLPDATGYMTARTAISRSLTRLIRQRSGQHISPRDLRSELNALILERTLNSRLTEANRLRQQQLGISQDHYRFQTTVAANYMKQSLALQYRQLYAAKNLITLTKAFADVVENKLEAIKINTRKADPSLFKTVKKWAVEHATGHAAAFAKSTLAPALANYLSADQRPDLDLAGRMATHAGRAEELLRRTKVGNTVVDLAQSKYNTLATALGPLGERLRGHAAGLDQKYNLSERYNPDALWEKSQTPRAMLANLLRMATAKPGAEGGHAAAAAEPVVNHADTATPGAPPSPAPESPAVPSLTTELIGHLTAFQKSFDDFKAFNTSSVDENRKFLQTWFETINNTLLAMGRGGGGGNAATGPAEPGSGPQRGRFGRVFSNLRHKVPNPTVGGIITGFAHAGLAVGMGTVRLYGGALGFAGRGIGATGRLLFGGRGRAPLVDVYLKNEVNPGYPLVSAEQFKAGLVLANGKRIKNVADIDQPVVDPTTGETLITAADIKHGLVDIHNRTILKSAYNITRRLFGAAAGVATGTLGLYGAGLRFAAKGIGAASNFLFRQRGRSPFADVYVKGDINLGRPLITARQLRAGLVFGNGKRVHNIADIDEPVIDPKTGETLITEDDIKKGLVNAHGESVSRHRATFSIAGGLLGLAGTAIKGTMGLAGNVAKMYSGMFGLGLKGIGGIGKLFTQGLTNLFGFGGRGKGKGMINEKDLYDLVSVRLDHIYELLDHRLCDCTGGSGKPRAGSYKDHMDKLRKARENLRHVVSGKGPGGRLGSIAALLGLGKSREHHDNDDDDDGDHGGIVDSLEHAGEGAIAGVIGRRAWRYTKGGGKLLYSLGKKGLTAAAGAAGLRTVERTGETTAAKAAAETAAKTAEKAGAAGLGKAAAGAAEKTAVKAGEKVAAKEAVEIGAKTVGKSLLKKVPFLGLAASGVFAAQRAWKGDWKGAGLELASGGASMLPGIGTAASVAIDAGLAYRDMQQTGNAAGIQGDGGPLLAARMRAYGADTSSQKAMYALENRIYRVLSGQDTKKLTFDELKAFAKSFGFDPNNFKAVEYFHQWLNTRMQQTLRTYMAVLRKYNQSMDNTTPLDGPTERKIYEEFNKAVAPIVDRYKAYAPSVTAFNDFVNHNQTPSGDLPPPPQAAMLPTAAVAGAAGATAAATPPTRQPWQGLTPTPANTNNASYDTAAFQRTGVQNAAFRPDGATPTRNPVNAGTYGDNNPIIQLPQRTPAPTSDSTSGSMGMGSRGATIIQLPTAAPSTHVAETERFAYNRGGTPGTGAAPMGRSRTQSGAPAPVIGNNYDSVPSGAAGNSYSGVPSGAVGNNYTSVPAVPGGGAAPGGGVATKPPVGGGVATTPPTGKAYYNTMYTALFKAAQEQGCPNPDAVAHLGAAQTCLETGYGKHVPGNNAFGIKGVGTTGTSNVNTQEFVNGHMVTMKQGFRQYNNVTESAADYIKFLQTNPRYKGVLAAKTPQEAIAAQAKTGYATDPDYGSKLASINHSNAATAPVLVASTSGPPQTTAVAATGATPTAQPAVATSTDSATSGTANPMLQNAALTTTTPAASGGDSAAPAGDAAPPAASPVPVPAQPSAARTPIGATPGYNPMLQQASYNPDTSSGPDQSVINPIRNSNTDAATFQQQTNQATQQQLAIQRQPPPTSPQMTTHPELLTNTRLIAEATQGLIPALGSIHRRLSDVHSHLQDVHGNNGIFSQMNDNLNKAASAPQTVFAPTIANSSQSGKQDGCHANVGLDVSKKRDARYAI